MVKVSGHVFVIERYCRVTERWNGHFGRLVLCRRTVAWAGHFFCLFTIIFVIVMNLLLYYSDKFDYLADI